MATALAQAEMDRYKLLYLPYSYALDSRAILGIRRFVEQGGTIVADGLFAWKDPPGNVCTRIPGVLRDVLGMEVDQIESIREPATLTGAEETAVEQFRMHLRLCGAEPFLKSSDGRPVATRHRFGKGEAIYFGTSLWAGYHKRPSPLVRLWATRVAEKFIQAMPVSAATAPEHVLVHGMKTSRGLLAIASNWGPKSELTVSFQGRWTGVTDLLSGRAATVEERDRRTWATIEVPAQGVLVLAPTSGRYASEVRP